MSEDYDPENEIDPMKIQKEALELQKKFMARLEKEDAMAQAARDAAKAPKAYLHAAPVYTPPTFEEVSLALKKAWYEVEAIMPTAGDQTKAFALQALWQVTSRSLFHL